MTNKSITILVVVLVVVVLGIGAAYLYNQQAPTQNSANTTTNTTTNTTATQNSNSQTQGKIVFGIKDAATSMGNVTAVTMTFQKIEMDNKDTQKWVTVSSGTGQFDLLALKASGITSLLAQTSVEAGTYDQIRLTISNVVVVANGVQQTAKLPSGELKIVGTTVVGANKTSTAVFDFIADQSLHVTGDGKFIFTPVVKTETRNGANAQITSNNEVNITGGKVESNTNAGMDINGEMKANFVLDANTKFDVVSNVLKVTVPGESDNSIKVTATTAINTAVSGGYLDSSISVTLVTQNGKKEWLVSGLKNLILTNVYVDATTGAVVK